MRIGRLGDVAIFGINVVATGTYRKRMQYARDVLSGCDYAIANLESPLTAAEKPVGDSRCVVTGADGTNSSRVG